MSIVKVSIAVALAISVLLNLFMGISNAAALESNEEIAKDIQHRNTLLAEKEMAVRDRLESIDLKVVTALLLYYKSCEYNNATIKWLWEMYFKYKDE